MAGCQATWLVILDVWISFPFSYAAIMYTTKSNFVPRKFVLALGDNGWHKLVELVIWVATMTKLGATASRDFRCCLRGRILCLGRSQRELTKPRIQ